MLIAAGAVAAIGYGAHTWLGHPGSRGIGQMGTFIVKDAYSGGPLPGAQVQAPLPGQEQGIVGATDGDGQYRLSGVPEGANLVVDAPSISRRPHPIERRTTLDLALRPDVVSGVVRDPQGRGVPGVT